MDQTGTHFQKQCIVEIKDEKDGRMKDKTVTIVGTTKDDFCQTCDQREICFSTGNSLNSYDSEIIHCIKHLPKSKKCHLCHPKEHFSYDVKNIRGNYIQICRKCFSKMVENHKELFGTCKYPQQKCNCKYCH